MTAYRLAHRPAQAKPRAPVAEHGDVRSYWRGCRCEPCRLAYREYQRKRKKKPKPAPGHGTVQRYWRGCKCEACLSAQAQYVAAKRRKDAPMTPAQGVALEALQAFVRQPVAIQGAWETAAMEQMPDAPQWRLLRTAAMLWQQSNGAG
jgi:hypothetical protein